MDDIGLRQAVIEALGAFVKACDEFSSTCRALRDFLRRN